MSAAPTRFNPKIETRALPVGVFEDDALLLRLTARLRFAESHCPRKSSQVNADELAFEAARLVESATWEL